MHETREWPDVGHRAVRKVMARFMPLIGLCYIAVYVDRLNIGVAALTMNDDLGISASAFGFTAGVYFWSYTVCEPPSNYILTKVGARRWLGRIMVTWGLVTIATATVQGTTSLACARVLLGIAEAGFSPGMLYFVSRWIPQRERGRAMAWIIAFICLSSLATPVTTQILGLDGLLGLAGWRWVFVFTGIPAIVLGCACVKILRDGPKDAEFLTAAERDWLVAELRSEDRGTTDAHGEHGFARSLVHPRVLVLVMVFVCFTFCLNGFQLWIPQILAQFGLSRSQVGWVATLPALLAIGPVLWWMRRSDRRQERTVHFAVAAAVAAAGFGLAAVSFSVPALAIAGFCVAGMGLYGAMGVFITMPSSFLTGVALAAGFGVINGAGNLGGYFGPQVTGWIKDATGGFTAAIGVYAVVLALAAAIVLALGATARRTSSPRLLTGAESTAGS
ncbi:MFS transporter [Actinoallomurus iriomotensis]|uniref:MFS transporter n=1 Tax=Actinoallomurus iriomotensis TaxID=478107 RepID=A0A9W6RNI2_9ACTN|nr:MFS transporter [Actinoallomurus iriomotensis]GLY78979.1 MFS transporter [Actinoallomurus iriomotensis]